MITEERLAEFCAACQKLIDKSYEQYDRIKPPKLAFTTGKRYARFVKHERNNDGTPAVGGSAYCFVDLDNGDVLKPDGWKRPAKHARGNLNDQNRGLGWMSGYGPAYLK